VAGGRAPTFIRRVLGEPLLERVQRLEPLAASAGISMARLAIAWTLQQDGVSSAIIGASRPDQVTQNAAAAGIRLPADLLAAIDDVLGDLIDRDPAKTAQMMSVKPGWAAQ
jgi:aryl-alcohol dehydrogenase-like predicted oxidoreductase